VAAHLAGDQPAHLSNATGAAQSAPACTGSATNSTRFTYTG